jgi:hypothetical protein
MELIGSWARLLSLLLNTMRLYVSVLEVVYRYDGEGERGTYTLLMAAGDYDRRRVLFHGAAPQIRGIERHREASRGIEKLDSRHREASRS